jgi:hypothetical protein
MLQSPILLALLLFQGSPQDLGQKITMTATARPAAKLLAEISEKTGVLLNAAGPVAEEILVLRVIDAPLRETLDKIAIAATAEWVVDGGRRTLIRTGQIIAKVRAGTRGIRVGKIAKALRQLRERLASAPPLNAHSIQAEFQREESQPSKPSSDSAGAWRGKDGASKKIDPPGPIPPTDRAIAQVVLDCWTADQLADFPEDEEIVFSTRPNAGQRPFPRDVGPVISTLDRESNLATMAYEVLMSAAGNLRYTACRTFGESPQSGIGDHVAVTAFNTRQAAGESVRLLLKVHRVYEFVTLELWAANSNGKVTASGRLELDESDAAPPQPLFPQPKAIVVPALAKRLIAMYSGSREEPTDIASSDPALVDRISNPAIYEPLADVPSGLLVASAEARGLNLVARVPEESMALICGLSALPQNDVETVGLLTDCDATVACSDHWMVIRSPNCLESFPRANRPALQLLIRRSLGLGRVGLEDWADYFAGDGDRIRFAEVILGAVGFYDFTGNDESALRIYGLLSGEQRSLLKSGRSLPVSRLGPDLMRAIRGLLTDYGCSVDKGGHEEEEGPAVEPDFGICTAKRTLTPLSSVHWTEALPNGIPPDAFLTLSECSEDSFSHDALTEEMTKFSRMYNLEDLAQAVLALRRPDLFGGGEAEDIGDLTVSIDRTVTLKVSFPNGLSTSADLTESVRRKDRYRVESLPADIKKKLEAAIQILLKQMTEPPPWRTSARTMPH